MRASDAASRTATALREALGAENVLSGDGVTAYRIGDAEPAVAALARDEADVTRVLARAFQESWGLVPWGGGAHQSVGGAPTRYDVALDLSRLNRVVAYEPADMTATVQAGMRVAALQQRLGEGGQCWPVDPPLADRATVGGVVAANLNGPLRCRYGMVRDLVLGVRVAHADGTVTKAGARVVKNATAYDLTKLYTGSHGTLGVLLEATLRLQPRPPVERGWLLRGAPLERCHEVAMRILGSHLAPNRVELVDRPDSLGCEARESGPVLLVSFAGVREAVQAQGASVEELAQQSGLEVAEIADPATIWQAVQDFPWRAPREGALPPARVLWRAGVLSSDCAKAMHAVQEAVSRFGTVAITATVSHGALRGILEAASVEDVPGGLGSVREALGALGGFLVVMDAPRVLRGTLDRWGPGPTEVALMRQIKMAFDPKGILNPGRFVDGI